MDLLKSGKTDPVGGRTCHPMNSCWAHKESAPTIPTKVDGTDAEALLDSSSMGSLIQPQLVGEHNRTPENHVAVSCLHEDTKEYPTTVVKLTTPQENCQLQVGLVPNLPVPYLGLGGKPNMTWPKNPSKSQQKTLFALPRGTRMEPPLSWDTRKNQQDPSIHSQSGSCQRKILGRGPSVSTSKVSSEQPTWVSKRQRIGSWLGVVRAVEDYCRSCPECQLTAPKPHFTNPLIPLPPIDQIE